MAAPRAADRTLRARRELSRCRASSVAGLRVVERPGRNQGGHRACNLVSNHLALRRPPGQAGQQDLRSVGRPSVNREFTEGFPFARLVAAGGIGLVLLPRGYSVDDSGIRIHTPLKPLAS